MMFPFDKYFSPHRSDSIQLDIKKELIKSITLIKEMEVFWRGCLEDLSESDEVPYLHTGVIIKLYESIKDMELELENRNVDNEHTLALAFEQGLYGISEIGPVKIRDICMTVGEKFEYYSEINEQVNTLIYGFAESLPDLFSYETYLTGVPHVRNLVKLIKSAGLPHELVIGDITGRF